MVENLQGPKRENLEGHLLSANTIFDRGTSTRPPEISNPYIPQRFRRAGKLLEDARRRNNVSLNKIAKVNFSYDDLDTLETFEKGEATIELPRVLHAAKQYINEQDPAMIEFEKIVEEEKWTKTLTRKGMTLNRALTLLRLSTLKKKEQFDKELHISTNQYSKYESGKIIPQSFILNEILKVSGLDTKGMPAQIVRLLRENRLPMDLPELQNCTFGTLFKYLRQLQGYVQPDVGRATNMSQTMIGKIENDRIKPRKQIADSLVNFLALDSRSALSQVICTKADRPTETIADDSIQQVITGKYDGHYFFAESLKGFETTGATTILNEFESKKKRLIRSGTPEKTIGTLLRHLREKHSLTQLTLSQRATMTQPDIWKIEQGITIPQNLTMARILNGMGYTIHNPITWYLLDVADTTERPYR